MRRRLMPIIVVASSMLALSGCAATSTPAAHTPTPTATKMPAVSLETTCEFLYGDNMDGPLPQAVDIVTKIAKDPNGSTVKKANVEKVLTRLESIRAHASSRVGSYIDAEIAPLKALDNIYKTGDNQTLNFDDFKEAGIELLNECPQ